MNRGLDWLEQSKKCLERDNFACRRCGSKAGLAAHHIIPYSKTRDNRLENLYTACKRCHRYLDNQYLRVGITNYVRLMIEQNKERELCNSEKEMSSKETSLSS